jgi:hypothetical protein
LVLSGCWYQWEREVTEGKGAGGYKYGGNIIYSWMKWKNKTF